MCEAVVSIGRILKPVGLRGELKIGLLTDFPERFEALQEVSIQTKEGRNQRCRITRMRYGPPFVYLIFEGLSSPEAVAHLQGGIVQVPETERVVLPEGTYFQSDFLGMEVFLENKVCLGKIEEMIETGSNDVFVVRHLEGEYLIPALQEIILSIDIENKRMIVDPPEGLLTL